MVCSIFGVIAPAIISFIVKNARNDRVAHLKIEKFIDFFFDDSNISVRKKMNDFVFVWKMIVARQSDNLAQTESAAIKKTEHKTMCRTIEFNELACVRIWSARRHAGLIVEHLRGKVVLATPQIQCNSIQHILLSTGQSSIQCGVQVNKKK